MLGPALDALLQAAGRPSGTVRAALQAYELVGALLGLFIAYLAYRGYRRNDSRPMLFLAIGFTLVLGLPLVIVPVYLLLPISGGQAVLQAGIQTLEIAGLLCIVYALRV
ncbi:DUF7521 family protein [Haloarcula litorea]|uniref:DUF7521 family protein n=1 Tax=Haloarcula litorea TaxID=3032579 RepID=UPI0023E778BD|nr:hypothetical protein [Halomicroarcula sp. GDY20]